MALRVPHSVPSGVGLRAVGVVVAAAALDVIGPIAMIIGLCL